jgi:hypothetical protein
VRSRAGDGPWRLGAVGARAVLLEAIERCEAAGTLGPLGPVADRPGLRRRLSHAFAGWTRTGQGEPSLIERPVEKAEREVFRAYRAILKKIDAVDEDGLAAWASRCLLKRPPASWRDLGAVVVMGLPARDRPTWRGLMALTRQARAVEVHLPWDDRLPEISSASCGRLRDRLRARGFEEIASHEGEGEVEVEVEVVTRPAGLAALGPCLFGDGGARLATDGLSLRGAPRGEGVALATARAVLDRIADGARPDDVTVFLPSADEQAALVVETLAAWGVPVEPELPSKLASDPSVTALLLAASLPAEDWEIGAMTRFLRNRMISPTWDDAPGRDALDRAAACLHAQRVYRGDQAIEKSLERSASRLKGNREGEDNARSLRAAEAARTVRSIFDAIRPEARSGPWWAQVDRLERLRVKLGLNGPGVESLREALEDHGAVLDGLERADETRSWSSFVTMAQGLAREMDGPSLIAPGASVRVTTIDRAGGLGTASVIIAGLAEGTFPRRDALDQGDPEASHAREAARFLMISALARQNLTLIYPTTDEKGQELLTAGFVEEVRRSLGPDAAASITREVRRLDPSFEPEFCVAGRDVRARAITEARDGRADALRLIARRGENRRVLDGAAIVLRLAEARSPFRPRYGRFDGRLSDPDAIADLTRRFAEDRPVLSASQLESLSHCPFQFFLRYATRVEPTEGPGELDADHAVRGSLVHRVLENFHQALASLDMPMETVVESMGAVLADVLDGEPPPVGDVDAGLRRIESLRFQRFVSTYAHQLKDYLLAHPDARPIVHRCEASFGFGEMGEADALEVGDGPDRVMIQGKIDRIDVFETPRGRLFRVIDYKTGHCPSKTEVKQGLALQLPLYAMAVERLVLKDGSRLMDFGYWSLKDSGFSPARGKLPRKNEAVVPLASWGRDLGRLERFIGDLLGRLRAGDFPVHPRVGPKDCGRVCDYRRVCRIGEVGRAGRAWPEQPVVNLDDDEDDNQP